MFKKISALTISLVATSTLTSILSANAIEKLSAKSGDIECAVAFKDGYIYTNGNSLHYNKKGIDVVLDKNGDYDYPLDKFSSNYVTISYNANRHYLVDLSNGQIINDHTIEENLEDTKSKLLNKLKNTETYGNNIIVEDYEDDDDFFRVLNDQYGDVWYKYIAKSKNGNSYKTYQGITNESGDYLDISQIANISIYDPTNNKTITFDKFDDTKKTGNNNDISIHLLNTVPIAQDDKYIYAVCNVSIGDISDSGNSVGAVDKIGMKHCFLQKISKEKSQSKGGAWLPNTVESYELFHSRMSVGSWSDYIDINDDLTIASNALVDAAFWRDEYSCNIQVKDNAIYMTKYTRHDHKLNTFKLDLIKEKLKLEDSSEDDDITSPSQVSLKTNENNWTKTDDDIATVKASENQSFDIFSNKSVSRDKNGNTWLIYKGTISKVDGTSLKEMYTCDPVLDELDVYDENNLIAWDSGHHLYSTTYKDNNNSNSGGGSHSSSGGSHSSSGGGHSGGSHSSDNQSDEDNISSSDNQGDENNIISNIIDNTPIKPIVKSGWNQSSDGSWYYYNDGNKSVGWVQQDDSWYYCNSEGIMQTGWINDNGAWYYLNSLSNGFKGAMQTGWINDNGTWYYLNPLSNGFKGAMQTGWINDDGTWYYLNTDGSMAINTTIDGYVLGYNGAWVK